MVEQLLTILIGILGGVGVGLQTPIANAIARRTGSAMSSLVVHMSGLVFSVILLLFYRDTTKFKDLGTVPWWMFAVGIFGVILYLTIAHTIPRIGVTTALTLIIVGQLTTGIIIDHFGLLEVATRSIDLTRLLGAGLLLAGAYLIAR